MVSSYSELFVMFTPQGSSDIHQPLQIGLNTKNDTIVGLLLQHIGYDMEGNVYSLVFHARFGL